jgi:hypothetical protein
MFNSAIPKSELSRQRLKSASAIDVDCRRLFALLSSKTQIYTAIVSVNICRVTLGFRFSRWPKAIEGQG